MNQLLLPAIICIIYFLLKYIEMKFIFKNVKPLKELLKDTGIVFIVSLVSIIVIDKFNLNEMVTDIKSTPTVFTSNPDF